MKKLLVFLMVLTLTACSIVPTPAPAPTAAPPQVVLVTVVVTEQQPPTPMSLPPTPMPEPPTPVPQPTAVPTNEPVPTVEPPPAAPGGPITLPDASGGGFFNNINISGTEIRLRCEPSAITFTATAMSPYIVDVTLYYRMEDQQGTYITEWKNRGEMETDDNGNFTLTFNVLDIHPDLRYYEKAWLDFEFVGLNKYGDVVGRSEKIIKQITYKKECK